MTDKLKKLLNDEELNKVNSGTLDEDSLKAIKYCAFNLIYKNRDLTVYDTCMKITLMLNHNTFPYENNYTGSIEDRGIIYEAIKPIKDLLS